MRHLLLGLCLIYALSTQFTLAQQSTRKLTLTLTDSIVIKGSAPDESYKEAIVDVRDNHIVVSNPYLWLGGYGSIHKLSGEEVFLHPCKFGTLYKSMSEEEQAQYAKQDSQMFMPFYHNELAGFYYWDSLLRYKLAFFSLDGEPHHTQYVELTTEAQDIFPDVDAPFTYGIMAMPDFTPYSYNGGLLHSSSADFEAPDDSTVMPGVSEFLGNSFCWLPLDDTTAEAHCFNTGVDYAAVGYRTDSTYTFDHAKQAVLLGDELYYANGMLPHLYRTNLKTNTRVRLAEFQDVLDPRRNTCDLGVNDNACGIPGRPRTTRTFICAIGEVPGVGIALVVMNLPDKAPENQRPWDAATHTLLIYSFDGERLYQDDDFVYHSLVSGHTAENELWVFPRMPKNYSGRPVIQRYTVSRSD